MIEMPKVVLLHSRRTTQFRDLLANAGVQPPYDLRSYTINDDTYNPYNAALHKFVGEADIVVYEEALQDFAPEALYTALNSTSYNTSLAAYDDTEVITVYQAGVVTEALR